MQKNEQEYVTTLFGYFSLTLKITLFFRKTDFIFSVVS